MFWYRRKGEGIADRNRKTDKSIIFLADRSIELVRSRGISYRKHSSLVIGLHY